MAARIVLMYHRVAVQADDPQELCVEPARFAEHVALLRSVGEVVPLEALARPGRRQRRPRFAITLDDGYADNALAAGPVLEALGAPATVFVVADAVGTGAFWWDRLGALLLGRPLPPRLELPLDGRTLTVDTRSPAGRARAYWAVWSRLRALPAEIEEALERLEETLGPAEVDPATRPMTESELVTLAARGVEIGGHTLTHPSLPALAPEEQRREIEGGRARLAELLGRPVETFAYPFGDHDDRAVRAVRRAGFRAACTVHEGPVTVFASRFLLPRYAVRNWTADELERRIAGLG